VRSSTLAVDVAIAVVAAVVLLIVSPGLAVVGLIAVLVLVLCGLSFLVDGWRRRRRRRPAVQTRRPTRRI
jgi:ABC-type bacteriocin/lantibiotic exporter with double-glycine peptidase domain